MSHVEYGSSFNSNDPGCVVRNGNNYYIGRMVIFTMWQFLDKVGRRWLGYTQTPSVETACFGTEVEAKNFLSEARSLAKERETASRKAFLERLCGKVEERMQGRPVLPESFVDTPLIPFLKEGLHQTGCTGSILTRLCNICENDNMEMLSDLLSHSEAEFLRTPNAGTVCLRAVKSLLATRDLTLGMDTSRLSCAYIRMRSE